MLTASIAEKVLDEIASGKRVRSRSMQRLREWIIQAALVGCGLFSVLITCSIILVLFSEALTFFTRSFRVGDDENFRVSLWQFLSGTRWDIGIGSQKRFGIWPLISGTLLVTAVAMAVALPTGLVTAVYLSEYAPKRLRNFLKPTLELLAGVPTVVFGFFALEVITPTLRWFSNVFEGYNALSAGIAVGILCIPIVCSLTEDALQAVPRSLREAALGLGGTKFDVATKVVVPAALSGIISAFLLAISRATGETMVVALAAGSTPRITLDPSKSVQTMTGMMASVAHGDSSTGSVEYYSIYAVGATLFLITFALTLIGQRVRLRYRETYK
jgi:phosphate transport system permease protein